MLKNFQGDSWGSIPPLLMLSLLPHDLCHGQSSLPSGVSLQLLCNDPALDLDVVLSPCYLFRDQKTLGECMHRGMDLISNLLRSVSASCDSRFMTMHSDKQVAWPGSVWELSNSNLSSHESGEWKKWRSLWEFHSWFFIGSCAVSWLVLKLWIKRADPSNLYKSESYRKG